MHYSRLDTRHAVDARHRSDGREIRLTALADQIKSDQIKSVQGSRSRSRIQDGGKQVQTLAGIKHRRILFNQDRIHGSSSARIRGEVTLMR